MPLPPPCCLLRHLCPRCSPFPPSLCPQVIRRKQKSKKRRQNAEQRRMLGYMGFRLPPGFDRSGGDATPSAVPTEVPLVRQGNPFSRAQPPYVFGGAPPPPQAQAAMAAQFGLAMPPLESPGPGTATGRSQPHKSGQRSTARARGGSGRGADTAAAAAPPAYVVLPPVPVPPRKPRSAGDPRPFLGQPEGAVKGPRRVLPAVVRDTWGRPEAEWDEVEKLRFLEGLRLHGKDFSRIASHIGNARCARGEREPPARPEASKQIRT